MLRLTKVMVPLEYSKERLRSICAERLHIEISRVMDVQILKRKTNTENREKIFFEMELAVELIGDEREVLYNNKDKKTFLWEPYSYKLTEYSPLSRGIGTGGKLEKRNRPVIIGSGPAGLFAALRLAEAGLEPVLFERGAAVEDRIQKVSEFWKNGILDKNTNVQFGEGGAGTFSDGKLKIGKKDGRKDWILKTLVAYGGPEEILFLEKPHIGTDRLIQILKGIRERILSLGGEFFFQKIVKGFEIESGKMRGIYYCGSSKVSKDIDESKKLDSKEMDFFETENVVLAIGHSAHDTFEWLFREGIPMEQKPMAIGVRIEHPQSWIDTLQYGAFAGNEKLGAADYKLVVHLEEERAVYTFCMCPGGQVVASASEENGIVTNGMSVFARNGRNANSAFLITLKPEDYPTESPLAGIQLRREIERKAFQAGGGNYFAPVQTLGDFMENRESESFGRVQPTYRPGTRFAKVESYLPEKLAEALRKAIPEMEAWMPGFFISDALITGPETRSSSPLRILRGETMETVGISGLYPAGEGAGYGGGIISAAVDGVLCAEQLLKKYFE